MLEFTICHILGVKIWFDQILRDSVYLALLAWTGCVHRSQTRCKVQESARRPLVLGNEIAHASQKWRFINRKFLPFPSHFFLLWNSWWSSRFPLWWSLVFRVLSLFVVTFQASLVLERGHIKSWPTRFWWVVYCVRVFFTTATTLLVDRNHKASHL